MKVQTIKNQKRGHNEEQGKQGAKEYNKIKKLVFVYCFKVFITLF